MGLLSWIFPSVDDRVANAKAHIAKERWAEARDELLEFVRGHAGRIQAADDGTHTGTRDRVNGDPLALEFAKHADVRDTARTATTEDEPDAGPAGVGQAGSGSQQETQGSERA